MDKRRAKEIILSPVMINVTHNGIPIYIESVNDEELTANIHSLDQPGRSQKVILTNLIEH